MHSIAIIALCIASAIFYGIVHDQITARVCVEYFTVFHTPIGTDDPTLLGLYWGVAATWWVGVLLGVPLAIAARAGSRRRRDARSLVRPIAILLVVMALSATIAGVIGWLIIGEGGGILAKGPDRRIPLEKEAAFVADLFAHNASYLVGFVGGIVVIVQVWWSRGPAGSLNSPAGLTGHDTN
jgi:hypothetical protein